MFLRLAEKHFDYSIVGLLGAPSQKAFDTWRKDPAVHQLAWYLVLSQHGEQLMHPCRHEVEACIVHLELGIGT